MTVTKAKNDAGTVDTTGVKASSVPGVPDLEAMKPDVLTAATDVAASGALVEPEIVSRIDTSHPAVDDRPRAGQSKAANRIDFNDPTLTDAEAVEANLKG